jgi:phosphatidylethanolamine/phosphatidyl-N-methylethanolamine N-methyltransferase
MQGLLQEYLAFFRGFASRPRATGAIAPSSRELARMMVRPFDLRSAGLVVEIGPGTGALTGTVLEGLADPARYLGLELNPDFVQKLREKFPQASFHNDSAEHIARYAAERGRQADLVVCGLPWAIFPDDLQERILGSIVEALRPGGGFTTFAYVHALRLGPARRFRRKLEERFERLEVSPIVWKNIPPAVAYWCTR